jgi:hypothetical protein
VPTDYNGGSNQPRLEIVMEAMVVRPLVIALNGGWRIHDTLSEFDQPLQYA